MRKVVCGMAGREVGNSEFGSARRARLILRKPVEAPMNRDSPADIF